MKFPIRVSARNRQSEWDTVVRVPLAVNITAVGFVAEMESEYRCGCQIVEGKTEHIFRCVKRQMEAE